MHLLLGVWLVAGGGGQMSPQGMDGAENVAGLHPRRVHRLRGMGR